MVAQCIEAFQEVGLEVGAEKTHWTCSPADPVASLSVAGMDVAWEPHLVFIGGVVNLLGNSGPAIDYRIAQAEKTFHRWKRLLLCRWIPTSRRLTLGVRVSAVVSCHVDTNNGTTDASGELGRRDVSPSGPNSAERC